MVDELDILISFCIASFFFFFLVSHSFLKINALILHGVLSCEKRNV